MVEQSQSQSQIKLGFICIFFFLQIQRHVIEE